MPANDKDRKRVYFRPKKKRELFGGKKEEKVEGESKEGLDAKGMKGEGSEHLRKVVNFSSRNGKTVSYSRSKSKRLYFSPANREKKKKKKTADGGRRTADDGRRTADLGCELYFSNSLCNCMPHPHNSHDELKNKIKKTQTFLVDSRWGSGMDKKRARPWARLN